MKRRASAVDGVFGDSLAKTSAASWMFTSLPYRNLDLISDLSGVCGGWTPNYPGFLARAPAEVALLLRA